jgi:hypothetical protein
MNMPSCCAAEISKSADAMSNITATTNEMPVSLLLCSVGHNLMAAMTGRMTLYSSFIYQHNRYV